jgi:hypothetical protein
MIAFAHIVFQFLADLLGLVALSIRPRRSLEAENSFCGVSSRFTKSAVSNPAAPIPRLE